ncbi:MAG: HEAT repeat domain-containing protein, partial [Planctomycetia bacterium]|nr:HEAT repeat domain-containing protein [Planctomycetia bacterium]
MDKIRWNFRKNLLSSARRLAVGACVVTLFISGTVFAMENNAENGAKNETENLVDAENFIWKTQPIEAWVKVLEASLNTSVDNQNEKLDGKSENVSRKSQKSKKSKKASKEKAENSENTPTIREQWYAAYALGEYGTEAVSAVPILLKRLELEAGADDDVRACILFSLGKIGDPSAFSAICDAFDSEYPIMRRTAAISVGFFPELLKKETETVTKMASILETRSEMELPLATNCAVTLWVLGETETVYDWVSAALASDRKDSFTRNFEIYQALSAVRQILTRSGLETFSDETDALTERITELVQKSRDTDVVLSACEILVQLGEAAIPAVLRAINS